jgi:cytidylate kinase
MKLKSNVRLLVTCDSGAGAGKTTAAKYLSKRYGLNLLTSGLLYRMVAQKLLVSKKKVTDITFLKKITKNISSKHLKNKKLYSPEVTEFTSKIAKIKKVRMLLRNYQKRFARKRLAVCEGRDQGLLFKNADVKFFFKCSLKIAARRRFKEFRKTDKKITLKEVESAIKQRNYTDVTRAFMPLRIPPGAVIISTSSISKKEMFRRISKIVEKKLLLKYGHNYKTR